MKLRKILCALLAAGVVFVSISCSSDGDTDTAVPVVPAVLTPNVTVTGSVSGNATEAGSGEITVTLANNTKFSDAVIALDVNASLVSYITIAATDGITVNAITLKEKVTADSTVLKANVSVTSSKAVDATTTVTAETALVKNVTEKTTGQLKYSFAPSALVTASESSLVAVCGAAAQNEFVVTLKGDTFKTDVLQAEDNKVDGDGNFYVTKYFTFAFDNSNLSVNYVRLVEPITTTDAGLTKARLLVEYTCKATEAATGTAKVNLTIAKDALASTTETKGKEIALNYVFGKDVVTSNGINTLVIQEEGSNGYSSTTGTLKAQYVGYTGTGYTESLTSGKGIFYSVKSENAITNAQIGVRYAMWNGKTQIRGVLVYVNGVCVNPTAAIKTVYHNKGSASKVTEGRWAYSDFLSNVPLNAGENTVYITGASSESQTSFVIPSGDSGSLPNIDCLIVKGPGITYGTDKSMYYTFECKSENDAGGSVTSNPVVTSAKEGSKVTVTASAKSGYTFECWTDGSTENPHEITISGATKIYAHFIPTGSAQQTGLVGFASVTSDAAAAAAYTITGGAGGETITINSLNDLTSETNKAKLSGNTPYIVKFTNSTRITTTDNLSLICNIGSNKTIYGAVEGAGLKNIEMRVSGNNVIIRNLIFGEVIAYDTLKEYAGQGNDALSLNGAQHVWVDHCELFSHLTPQDNLGNAITASVDAKDWYDGLLDLKNGAAWITISNCYFHDHWKAFLCGSGDAHDDGDSNMRLTIVGCFFKNINSRQPLFRWGKAHIYNNYFLSEEGSTVYRDSNCIDVRTGSTILAEANYFSGVKNPIGIDLANGGTNGKEEYSFPASNQLENCVNDPQPGSSTYKPAYVYTAATASKDVANTAGAKLGTTLTY